MAYWKAKNGTTPLKDKPAWGDAPHKHPHAPRKRGHISQSEHQRRESEKFTEKGRMKTKSQKGKEMTKDTIAHWKWANPDLDYETEVKKREARRKK